MSIFPRPLKKVLGKIIPFSKEDKVPTFNLGDGVADGTTFLRGDGTWASPGSSGYVPYIGATQDVDLGEFGVDAGHIVFDTTPTAVPTDQGTLSWDPDHNTLQLQMNGDVGQLMQDTFYFVKNQSGSAIPKGTVVRAAGTLGSSGRILIEPFLADGTYPSKYCMGVTSENIPNGGEGMVMHFGQIRQINLSAYTDGDILYASDTVAGGFTTTRPDAPNNIITIAIVIHAASNGVLQVRPTFSSNINDDEGVYFPTPPTNGQVLTFNGTSGLWEAQTVPTGITVGTTPVTSGTDGRVFFQSSGVVQQDSSFFWDNTNKRLGIGTSSPATGTVIDANGRIKSVGLSSDYLNNTANTVTLIQFSGNGNRIFDNSGVHVVNIRSGNFGIGIGTNIPAARLDVRAQGALSTDIAFRVRNSADTFDIIRAKGDGTVSIGIGAGNVNTGSNNNFFGGNAGRDTTTATNNNFFGFQAGRFNTTGNNNSFFGASAGRDNTTGGQNSFFGLSAGLSNTIGSENTALGVNSGVNNTTGNNNSFFGNSAGRFIADNTTANAISNNSVFLGASTKANANNQTNQIVIGFDAIGLGSNTAVLGNSSITLTRLQGNVAIGADTAGARLDVRAQGALSTDIAFRVRNSADTDNIITVTGNGNLGVGTATPLTTLHVKGSATSGFDAIRFSSQYSGVGFLGSDNSFAWFSSGAGYTGSSVSVDSSNLRFRGNTILFQNGSGTETIRILSTGFTGIGTNSPQARLDVRAQGALSTDIAFRVRNSADTANLLSLNGTGVLSISSIGNDITINGVNIGRGGGNIDTNTRVGTNAGFFNTTGNNNSFFGRNSGFNNTTGSNNVFYGLNSGRFILGGGSLTIANDSVFIGYDTRANANSETNQIVIGHNAIGTGSNSVTLGNTSITRTNLRGQVVISGFASAPTGVEGAIYYDSTTKKHYGFDGTTWNALY